MTTLDFATCCRHLSGMFHMRLELHGFFGLSLSQGGAAHGAGARPRRRPEHRGNSYLRDSYERYVGKIAALRTHLAMKPLHTRLSFQEHQEMLETIRSRDVEGTKAILAIHIGRTRQSYSAGIEDIAAADKEITEAS